jgi:uncharacterized membrane protein YraQ (UPF0718 family)
LPTALSTIPAPPAEGTGALAWGVGVLLVVGVFGALLPRRLAHNARTQHKLVAISAGLLLGGVVHLALDAVGLGHVDLGGGDGSLSELAHGGHAHDGHDGHDDHEHAGHDHAGHDHAGHAHVGSPAESDSADSGHADHDDAAHDHADHDHSAHAGHAHLDLTDPFLWLAFLGSFGGLLGLQRLLLHRHLGLGHAHGAPGEQDHAARHSLAWRATYVGLALHAALAGLGFGGLLAGQEPTLVWSLLVAMALHKGTECLSLATLMQLAEVPLGKFALWMGAFCTITPLATWLGGTTVVELGAFATYASAVAAGTFLAVSVADLLPEAFHERSHRWSQFGLLLAGALAGAGLPLLLAGDGLERALVAALDVFVEMAPFLLLGFAAAGVLSQLLSKDLLQRWFAGPGSGPVLRASVAGAPLPLCSCSVVPVAASLNAAGASRGATSAFLISTPETGVDSVMLTASLFDPVMTVARPLSAVASAVVTGGLVTAFGEEPAGAAPPAPVEVQSCCHEEPEPEPEPESSCCHGTDEPAAVEARGGWSLAAALRHGFVDMVDDLAWPLALGVVLSGLMAALIPDAWFEGSWMAGPLGLFAMLAIGLPVYICAAASTPLAATLVLKGLSPGAALVLLLASPATNLGSLLVVRNLLGRRGLLIHLASLSVTTLLLGFALNGVYALLDREPVARLGDHVHVLPSGVHDAAAVLLALLLFSSVLRRVSGTAGSSARSHAAVA